MVERRHQPQVGTYLLPQSWGGEAVGTAFHALPGAADITSDGSKATAGILDEAPYHHIGPQVRRLQRLHKLTITVIHHHLYIRLHLLTKGDYLPDLSDGKGRASGIALGTLDGDEFRTVIDSGPDGVIVKGAVRCQLRLGVGDAILPQGALALANADDLFKGIIAICFENCSR